MKVLGSIYTSQNFAERKRARDRIYQRKRRENAAFRAKDALRVRRYKKSMAGRKAAKRYYANLRADTVRWRHFLDLKKKNGWHKTNPKEHQEARRRWFKTEKGLRLKDRDNRRLPACTPDSLIQAIKLLEVLKQEKRSHGY